MIETVGRLITEELAENRGDLQDVIGAVFQSKGRCLFSQALEQRQVLMRKVVPTPIFVPDEVIIFKEFRKSRRRMNPPKAQTASSLELRKN